MNRKLIYILSFILIILVISIFIYINSGSSLEKAKDVIKKTDKIILSPNSDDTAIKREIGETDVKEIIRILLNIEKDSNELIAGVGQSFRLTLYDSNYKKLLAIECVPDISISHKSYSIKLNKEDLEKLTKIIMKYDLKYYYDTYIKDI